MTAPLQAVVGVLTGLGFTYESGYGYVSLAHRLVIAKSCSGANYLLAVFGLLAFTVIPSVDGQRRKLAHIFVLAAVAYGVTIVVNSARIALGVVLHDAGVAWGWLTAERVHRLLGITLYFGALLAVHAVARRRAARPRPGMPGWFTTPFVWYGLIAIAVPIVHSLWGGRPERFVEHCASIAAVTLLFAGALALVHGRARRYRAQLSYWTSPPLSQPGPNKKAF
jgi:exosortase K